MPNKPPSSNPPLELCNSTLEQEILTALVHLSVPPEGLVPGDFAIPEYRRAFRIIMSMHHRGEAVTPESFLEQAKKEGVEQTATDITLGYFHDIPLEMQIKRLKGYTRKREIHQLAQRYACGRISEERFFKAMELLQEEKQEKTLPTPVSVETLLEVSHPEAIWGNVIFKGALHLLSSDPGVGKTTLCYALAVALAEGREFLGDKLSPLRVGYFDLETPAPLRAMKLRVLDCQPGEGMLFFDSSCPVELLPGLVKKHRLDLLIIDTASLFFGVKREEDNAEVNEKVVKPLKELTREGVAVILVHHNSKGARERSRVYRSRGASALPAGCDVVMSLENTADEDTLKLEVTKNRIAGYTPTLYLRKDEGSFTVVEKPDSEFTKTQKAEQKILEILRLNREPKTLKWLMNALPMFSEKTIRIALQNLTTIGRVVKPERGIYALPPSGKESGNGNGKVQKRLPDLPDGAETRMGSGKESGKASGKRSGKLPEFGKSGNDVSPYIPVGEEDEVLSLGEESISIPVCGDTVLPDLPEFGKASGKLPNALPDALPDANPHKSRLPDTSGKSGNQSHTLPDALPDLPEDRGRTPSTISPPISWKKWKFHGVI